MGEQQGDALDSTMEKFLNKDVHQTVDIMKAKLTRMQEKLDAEVKRADRTESEMKRLQIKGEPLSPTTQADATAAQASTQLMRVVEQWMRNRDLEEVLLRRTCLTDASFGVLVHCLMQSKSLHTLDLSENELTMASVSDLAQILTLVESNLMLSVARNSLPIECIGYFMTAMLERAAKDLPPPVLINLQNNVGLLAEENHGQETLNMQERCKALVGMNISPRAANLLVSVSKSLWQFLTDTGHPLLPRGAADTPQWSKLDQGTHSKFLEALRPIVILEEVINGEPRTIGAWMAIAETHDAADDTIIEEEGEMQEERQEEVKETLQNQQRTSVRVQDQRQAQAQLLMETQAETVEIGDSLDQTLQEQTKTIAKATTFNLKQVVQKNGMILMNILERILETTAIDATDVETNRTLLEHAAIHGNMSLAKLCYRRGMNMSALTAKGETAFTIATAQKNYGMMEFLHLYGVKANSQDGKGQTALHIATSINDVDGICRMIEWGADVNLRDNERRTPLHHAARHGHMDVAMLLLELAADMNARDVKDFTAVAHAEANDHFKLMDRLVELGGKLYNSFTAYDNATITEQIGTVDQPKFMKKSVSLLRLKKLPVPLP